MKNKYTRLFALMQALWAHINGPNPENTLRYVGNARSYLHRIETKISYEGKARTCAHFKAIHGIAMKLVLREQFSPIPFCASDKQGIPKELSPLKGLLLSEDPNFNRLGLTITRFYEKIVLPRDWKPDPITQAGPELTPERKQSLTDFADIGVKRLGISESCFPSSTKLHASLSQGPNGPALFCAHRDAVAVSRNSILNKTFEKLCTISGMQGLIDLKDKMCFLDLDYQPMHSRLALLQQGGGKTRVIAMGDLGSQSSLKPLHDKVMSGLRKMETDGTYAQDDQFQRILKRSYGHKTFCFDLSSATDRFPIEVQVILLTSIFGREYAEVGRSIMTQRAFHVVVPRKRKEPIRDEVKGAQGQPLGLLSSWAVFALTHHFVIEYLAYNSELNRFRDYAVLGDDVSIGNTQVAIDYETLMKEFGVEINYTKSIISDNRLHRVEFAKRIARDGIEVTGLKWHILTQASKSIYSLVDLIRVAKMRSGPVDECVFEAPPFQNEVGKELLSVLLGEFSRRETPPILIEGKSTAHGITIESLKTEVLKQRLLSLKEKIDKLNDVYKRNIPLAKHFEKFEGVAYTQLLIGTKDFLDNHPMNIVYNEQIKSLFMTLDDFEEAIDEGLGSDDVPILPAEYLPLPDTSIYVGEKHLLRTTYHSRLVLKAGSKLTKRIED